MAGLSTASCSGASHQSGIELEKNPALLEITSVSVDVPGRQLLRDAALTVEAQESVAIMGPSGSGKTSLLNCLSGIARPSAGVISIGGTELTSLAPGECSAFRLHHVGMVFQFGELLPELSAAENVALPLRLAGTSRRKSRQHAAEWLERLGLENKGEEHPDRLSGGEVQRVGIARALAGEPSLVLADEPTGALDETTSAAIAELLAETARESNVVVVVATHDPVVAAAAGRVLRIQDGALTCAAAPADASGVAQ